MQVTNLPGLVVHIRMEAESLNVFFENVPWPLNLTDIAGAVDAFSNNDQGYFHRRWWEAHPHVLTPSPVLRQLAYCINPYQRYDASSLMELALAEDLFQGMERVESCCQYQRLALIPHTHQWPEAPDCGVSLLSQPACVGWPGHLWISAILEFDSDPITETCAVFSESSYLAGVSSLGLRTA